MKKEYSCCSCGSSEMEIFYTVTGVPVHSVLLMPDRESALSYPKGDIALGLCHVCGFISNVAFDPGVHEYSSRYEETQGFSSTYNAFAHRLAEGLIDRYGLHAKKIIEIGCGKGEFLSLLCELGGNTGIGFDPAYVDERDHSKVKDRITFIKDFYSEKYTHHKGDFVCCKMTLEHIRNTGDFVGMVRRSVGDRTDAVVFFQVPDSVRILRDAAFWDIYYEHCSYFSLGSLARLFKRSDFRVCDLWSDYDGQYIMIGAWPGRNDKALPLPAEEDVETLRREVKLFSKKVGEKLDEWKQSLSEFNRKGMKTVLWGGGSKGVAFLTTLGISKEVGYIVDINPFKEGTYMAGTGHKIVGPEFLRTYRPDIVIIMNPVYRDEITAKCVSLGLSPEIRTV
jgi:SAM-dependent methyltransferase